jgi:hypothetical protein
VGVLAAVDSNADGPVETVTVPDHVDGRKMIIAQLLIEEIVSLQYNSRI